MPPKRTKKTETPKEIENGDAGTQTTPTASNETLSNDTSSVPQETIQPTPADPLDAIVKNLSEQVEKPEETVLSEIMAYVNEEHCSVMGAVVKWKSKNKNLLGTKLEMYVRVIGRDGIRTAPLGEGKSQRVTNVSLLVANPDSTVSVKDVSLWGDRVEMADEFKLNSVYKIQAKESQGRLGYVKILNNGQADPTQPCPVPELKDLPQHGVEFAKPGNIIDYLGRMDLFHGWVGKIIRDKTSGVVIGFELGDAESFPVTVWGSEKFGPIPAELKESLQNLSEGSEVLVYGYVSQSKNQGDPRINLKGVFVVG